MDPRRSSYPLSKTLANSGYNAPELRLPRQEVDNFDNDGGDESWFFLPNNSPVGLDDETVEGSASSVPLDFLSWELARNEVANMDSEEDGNRLEDMIY